MRAYHVSVHELLTRASAQAKKNGDLFAYACIESAIIKIEERDMRIAEESRAKQGKL